MTPEQMAALTPAEMESTCVNCGHSDAEHDGFGWCTATVGLGGSEQPEIEDGGTCDCDRFRSVWNAGEAQDEQRYSRP